MGALSYSYHYFFILPRLAGEWPIFAADCMLIYRRRRLWGMPHSPASFASAPLLPQLTSSPLLRRAIPADLFPRPPPVLPDVAVFAIFALISSQRRQSSAR